MNSIPKFERILADSKVDFNSNLHEKKMDKLGKLKSDKMAKKSLSRKDMGKKVTATSSRPKEYRPSKNCQNLNLREMLMRKIGANSKNPAQVRQRSRSKSSSAH